LILAFAFLACSTWTYGPVNVVVFPDPLFCGHVMPR
jgi:hypothetical protein